ncbi:MAG: lamin tail domain-containing protein, partial [Verrucomicrobiota bacterium]
MNTKAFVLIAALFAGVSACAQPIFEPLGPSSRRTPFAISEIMYKSASRADGRNLEFIELYNSNPWPEDISNYQLGGQVQFTFPTATVIPGQRFLVVAAAPVDMQVVYGLTNVVGPYTNSLKTSGTMKLYDEEGLLLLDVNYDDITPWPMGADGTGHSIVLARPSYGEGDPRAWERSELAGGSPGMTEVIQTNALRTVVLNEVLAHTDPPDIDSIELYNHGNAAVDLSGCTLSDAPATNKFVIPAGTIIPASGFVYFTETQLGFGLNAAGETIYFKNTNATQVLDTLKFGAQENGVSFGRYPDGAAEWSRGTPTLGTNNAPPLVSAVGFNEIMYHPLVGGDDAQYVEMFNHGMNAVNLGGWKLGGGISWTFASNQVLAAGGYLVVGRNTTYLFTNYAQLNAANTVGNFGGKLSHSGEHLTLTMPDTTTNTNGSGRVTTNYLDIVVDEVTYGTGGRWGLWSGGDGSSLELIDARSDKRRASNWADSDDTAKSSWANIECTGKLDNGAVNGGGISFAQLGLLDAGECLVDNVEVRPGTNGSNYVSNPNFDSGLTNWTLLGNHSRSSLETNWGYPSGGPCLHLRASSGLEVGPNGTQVTLTNTLASGSTATLRFKARWLHGWPEPLLRLRGNYLEATGKLPVPANLGTPGLPNSRAATNCGPAIYQVSHSPAVPAAFQSVVVTARVSDPDGVASLVLRYRNDPATNLTSVAMNDAGTNGDAVAGDGIFSATIPGCAAKSAVEFTLLATDNLGATSTFPEFVPDNAPPRECVIIFDDPTPANIFGTYHLWLSRANVTRWTTLPVMSNEDIDGTLVYNGRAIYNMGGHYSGSPWHQYYDSPAGNRACHYVWSLPQDDMMLGTASFNKIHWPGNDIYQDTSTSNVNDPTLQREQAANTFLRGLGAPWVYRRFVAVYVNGVRRGNLMEDAYRPTASAVGHEYFPDDTDSQYYKLGAWYEYGVLYFSSFVNESWCTLQKYTTTGGAWKPARYRANWAMSSTPDSLSNFTNVYALVTATTATGQGNYPDLVENVIDPENWMRVSAANHAAGNWDCFGSTGYGQGCGQNVFGWISPQHRWTLFTHDLNICLGNSIANGPGASMFTFSDPVWAQIYSRPKFKRMYYRALKELVNGPMLASKINPIMDAKFAAFQAAGLSVTSPSGTESWIASAQSSIASQVASADVADFSVAYTNFDVTANIITLTGSAPFQVTTLWINGEPFTPLWTSATAWSLTLPVAFGTNYLTVSATDRFGNAVGGSQLVTAVNSGQPESPAGSVVINEIMCHPAAAGGQFVELFNRATNTTFDLSGWTVNGLGYTFPPGSLLAPQKYLVLAKSRTVFAASYGGLISVFDEFSGTLQTDGETLSLIQPGATNVVVDRVRYETNAPWPTNAALVAGVSLQLVDQAQDNSRVANWSSSLVSKATPGAANSVAATLPEFPPLWLNEVQAENVTGPADNFGEHDPWVELYNAGTDAISLDGFYLGTNYTSATNWAFPPTASIAPGQFLVVWLDG